MKNIITIDFDIIMAPCIQLYNNMVPNFNWEQLRKTFPQMQLLNADLIHYQRLTKWLLKIIKEIPKENIIFIENHGAINKYLPKEKVNIYNIDHHHDCGYGEKTKTREELNCGNWVYDIARHNFLNTYTWIKNVNSSQEKEKYEGLINHQFDLVNYELKNLPKPDLLILCLSEPWTPPEYRPLFYLWKELLEQYYQTNYTIDYQINFDKEDYYGILN